jgi:hypothetical protein
MAADIRTVAAEITIKAHCRPSLPNPLPLR